MIDVHILTLDSERKDWLEQCLASLVNEPIDLHVIEGTIGHIGDGRARGFAIGEHPLVSFVDPDDYVLPGGFAACENYLNDHHECEAVGTHEFIFVEGKNISRCRESKTPHHLIVFRRSSINQWINELRTTQRVPIHWLLTKLSPIPMIQRPYYCWRIHGNAWHLTTLKENARAYHALRHY